jgi:hypothetical protein
MSKPLKFVRRPERDRIDRQAGKLAAAAQEIHRLKMRLAKAERALELAQARSEGSGTP